MPVALRAVLFEMAEKHGITVSDIINHVLWDFVPTMRHSEPMRGAGCCPGMRSTSAPAARANEEEHLRHL